MLPTELEQTPASQKRAVFHFVMFFYVAHSSPIETGVSEPIAPGGRKYTRERKPEVMPRVNEIPEISVNFLLMAMEP